MPGLSPYVRILAAGERSVLPIPGTTIFLRNADGEIRVTLRQTKPGEDAQAYTLRMNVAEEWLHAVEFSSVEIENTSGVDNQIELYIGYGRFIKPVPDLVNVKVDQTNPLQVDVQSSAAVAAASSDVSTFLDVSGIGQGSAGAVSIFAFNAARVRAIITSPDTNVDTLRIGGPDVNISRGIPLKPGESIPWDSQAAAYVCSEGSTSDQVIAALEFIL